MTSFAFILGCVPLWTASGAARLGARQIMGTTVIGGMLAATCIAIFLIPVMFVIVEADRQRAAPSASGRSCRRCRGSNRQRRRVTCSASPPIDVAGAGGDSRLRLRRGPNYKRPASSNRQPTADCPQTTPATESASFGDQNWWEVFQDDTLQQMIRTALQQNYDRAHRRDADPRRRRRSSASPAPTSIPPSPPAPQPSNERFPRVAFLAGVRRPASPSERVAGLGARLLGKVPTRHGSGARRPAGEGWARQAVSARWSVTWRPPTSSSASWTSSWRSRARRWPRAATRCA